MDWQVIKAQVKAQIDLDFPIRRKQIKMTPLHKDIVLLVATASRPIRFRQIATILTGDEPLAPGWVDKVCQLALALDELRKADVLECSAVGWTKKESTHVA